MDVTETCIDDEQWHAQLDAIVADGLGDGPTTLHANSPHTISLDAAPGIDLIRRLATTIPHRLDAGDAVRYLRATERALGWLAALQSDALVAIAGPRPQIDVYEVAGAPVISIEDASRSEIAAATGWSESWTHDRVVTARFLHGLLPLTRTALARGRISSRQADVIATAAHRLSGYARWADGSADQDSDEDGEAFRSACADLEGAVIAVAERRGVSATRRAADRAVLRIDAAAAAHRRRDARNTRDVRVIDEGDGIAVLLARMGIEQAHACLTAIDALAHSARADGPLTQGGAAARDDRLIGERRADALVHLVLRDTATPEPTAIRTHVDVVIDLPTLLGLAEEPGAIRGGGPGGPMPVAAEVIRRLVASDASATMRRLVCDPLTGHLLDRGRTTYRVPDALRAFIEDRDRTCRFPGCHRRAGLTQIDHAIPWDAGGATSRENVGALCTRHHQLKTHAGWAITASTSDGSCRWRSPSGFGYEHPAQPLTGPTDRFPAPDRPDTDRPDPDPPGPGP